MPTPAPPPPAPVKGVRGGILALVTLLVGVLLGVVIGYVWFVTNWGRTELSTFAIFAISMLIGIAGALVFLVVQMLVEEEEHVMGRIMRSQYGIAPGAMAALFVLSGGLVAGFSQASTGAFAAGNLWTTFLIGFGWQGVIAGISSSAAVRDTAKEADKGMEQVKDESVKAFETVVPPLLEKIKSLQDQIVRANASPPPSSTSSLGTVMPEGTP
jgi:hypothetical protein